MRLFPQSIAGRTAAVLMVGTLVVLAMGAGITLFGVAGHGNRPSAGQFVDRATMAVIMVRGAAPGQRTRILRDAREGGVDIRILAGGTSRSNVYGDAFTDGVRRDLVDRLTPVGIRTVAVGHEATAGDGPPRHFWSHRGPIVARFRLADGTLLQASMDEGWGIGTLASGIGPPLLVVGAGLVALALWTAWRVTRPLAQFVRAASRLGADVRTPLLPESGPTEVRRAAGAFNATQRRIRRLLDDRLQMIAAIAHDLRTPIMRLRLRAESLEDDDMRTRVEADLTEMETMISGTLEFARAGSATEPVAMIDLADTVRTIGSELAELGQKIRVRVPETVPYEGSPSGLKRALRNLAENAVEYGGETEVQLRQEVAGVTVTITDCGPGISEADLAKVFDAFYRVDPSRSRTTGGTGLGLTVARTIVRRHGGDITLTNAATGGLRQTVWLPSVQH